MLDTAPRSCPCCDATDIVPWPQYSPQDWQIVRCTACDMTYLRNPVAYEALEEDFAWEKTYEVKKEASKGSTSLSPGIRALRKKLGLTHRNKHDKYRVWFNDGHVLDIGCGHGGRIAPPMTPYGIELSKGLHAQADTYMREQGGYCAHGAGAEAIWTFDQGQFDGIIMHSYLEHETDVMQVLKGSHRALKESGAIYIRVPNFGSINRRLVGAKWCGFRYPDHVNYFTLKTLTETARKAGFDTELVNKLALPVDDNITVLLHKAGRA
ncbi:class I SAM-dependent methyltransferase [uncultured Roseobacter sp.]|uniref:class I SAM-dependent methyltransferase n=1 Tax=uncultured Roseobacter sp. TaxID=114847 RepID=UPI002638E672|nr:class I SAM-dependent methyltransferase [uncultured Roseobacter sp.]